MLYRCNEPKSKDYKNYGGRGITVCREWADSFEAFFQWALANGWRRGLEIDREKNNNDYSPGNCRFVTHGMNQRNKRSRGKAGYRGVYPHDGKWVAHIFVSYTDRKRIGTFSTPEEAARAYDSAAREYGFPLNFPA